MSDILNLYDRSICYSDIFLKCSFNFVGGKKNMVMVSSFITVCHQRVENSVLIVNLKPFWWHAVTFDEWSSNVTVTLNTFLKNPKYSIQIFKIHVIKIHESRSVIICHCGSEKGFKIARSTVIRQYDDILGSYCLLSMLGLDLLTIQNLSYECSVWIQLTTVRSASSGQAEHEPQSAALVNQSVDDHC